MNIGIRMHNLHQRQNMSLDRKSKKRQNELKTNGKITTVKTQ